MPSLKDVKGKIAGVAKTKQITKAMYMVASAKLRGAQTRIERFRPYAQKFYDILGLLAGCSEDVAHPLLEVHKEEKRVLIVLVTSDRGLCGSLNVSLIAKAMDEARARTAQGKEVAFLSIGRKGRDAIAKSGFELQHFYAEEPGGLDYAMAGRLGRDVISAYEQYQADEVIIVYSEFRSVASQPATVLPLLPVTSRPPAHADEVPADGYALESHAAPDFIYEPPAPQLLAQLLPAYVNAQIYRTLLDSTASENAARMMAMDNATRNCDELISTLTLLYNKTRQASITTELIDIVSGANAL